MMAARLSSIFRLVVALLAGWAGTVNGDSWMPKTLDSGNSCPSTFAAADASGAIYIGCAFQATGLQIRKITVPGYVNSLVLTTYDFGNVWGGAIDKANGILYVANRGGNIHKANLATGAASVFSTATASNGFWEPQGVACDAAGNVYVADSQKGRIVKITPAGVDSVFWSPGVGTVIAVTIDSTYIYAGANGLKRMLLAAPNTVTTALSTPGNGYNGIVSDAAGNVYVASMYSNALQMLDPTLQTMTTLAAGVNAPAGVGLAGDGVSVVIAAYGGQYATMYTPRLPLFQPPFLPPVSTVFSYTGARQAYVVPANTFSVQIDACGGEGGEGGAGYGVGNARGGYIQSRIPVTPGSTLYVYVGGAGDTGGYNGGGLAHGYGVSNGGGGTDIRTADGGISGAANANTRLVVAGGAGGNDNGNPSVTISTNLGGGNMGGGLIGGSGHSGAGAGQGGTQTAGGASTQDCTGGGTGTGCASGLFWAGGSPAIGRGGGGGWYGGGAGSGNTAAGGGSSYTVAAGTILQNVQGHPLCFGDGFLAVSLTNEASTGAGAVATSPPLPTRVFNQKVTADFLWASIHNGPHCNSTVVGFGIRAFSLEQCMPSNDASSNFHPYVQKCYVGKTGLSVIRDTYSDFACTQVDPRGKGKGVIYHAPLYCRAHKLSPGSGKVMSGKTGQSYRERCDKLPSSMAARDMVVLQSFLRPDCGGGVTGSGANPEVLSIFLNTCAFYIDAAGQFHRKLTYVSGDGLSTNLVLTETRYSKADKKCSGSIVRQATIAMPYVDGTGTCLPDPLHPGRFYFNLLRSLDYNAPASQREWSMQPVWAQPTPRPSRPTPAPSQNPLTTGLVFLYRFDVGDVDANRQVANWASGSAVYDGAYLRQTDAVIYTTAPRVGSGSLQLNTAASTSCNNIIDANNPTCGYFQLPTPFTLPATGFSLSYWFAEYAGPAWTAHFGLGSGTGESSEFRGNAMYTVSNGQGNLRSMATDAAFDGTWHHVVMSFSTTSISNYWVDGVRTTTDANFGPPPLAQARTRCFFGRHDERSWGTPYFMGYMDDIRLYSRVLGAADVALLFSLR